MLSLEEYISQRKKEDGINDSDVSARYNNAKKCAGYVFDYYTTYLDSLPEDNETILQFEKKEKYRKQLNGYSSDIQDWLVQIYADYGNMLTRLIAKPLNEDAFFFLHYKPEEFETMTYDVYAKLIGKCPYLHGQNAKLKQLITEYHHINSNPRWGFPVIDDSVDKWCVETYDKYGVNLNFFAEGWVWDFREHPELWAKGTKKKSDYAGCGWNKWDYEYDYSKSDVNLFGIDTLFRDVPKHPFLRGKKQEMLTLIIYYGIAPGRTNEEANAYWNNYLSKIK